MSKFVVELLNQKVVMSMEQFDSVLEVLRSCTIIHSQYVGGNLGDDGTPYKKLIRPFSLDEIKVSVTPDDTYDSQVLVTKLWDESQKK